MDLLIHATLTVTGAREQLATYDERIKTLLVEEIFEGGFEEHHGDDALSYDFKVRGGIPFPAFAAASQEFPGMIITAEWVNMGGGRKGRAQIAAGAITTHTEEPIALVSRDVRNRYVRTRVDGTLELALALVDTGLQIWSGYVLTHARDALIQVTRTGAAVEVLATDGEPEWAQRWQLVDVNDSPAAALVLQAQPIEKERYAELEQLAESFVADWIWFREAPPAENAIDIDRFARYGFTVRDANVRASRLHTLRSEIGTGQPLTHSTMDADCEWIVAVLERCWAVDSTTG